MKIDFGEGIGDSLTAAARAILPLDRYRISGVSTEVGRVTIELVQR